MKKETTHKTTYTITLRDDLPDVQKMSVNDLIRQLNLIPGDLKVDVIGGSMTGIILRMEVDHNEET